MLLYHYTDSESLVEIVKEKLILATEGSVFDHGAKESVFFSTKVNFDIKYLAIVDKMLAAYVGPVDV